MNFKFFLLASALFLSATTASAGWNPTTISLVQMPINSTTVVVYFDTNIKHDDCPNPSVSSVVGVQLKNIEANKNFEEMYARLLIAEQSNETIQILSSYGECDAGGNWVTTPYIRFGN